MSPRKIIAIACAALAALAYWSSLGCSGGSKPTSIEEATLQYQKGEAVTFSIQGTAACSVCTSKKLPVDGMQVEVLPKDDPMHSLGFQSFDGLGPFTITGVAAESGKTLEVLGTLFLEGGSEPSTMSAYGEVTVPDEDGALVTVTIKFPSSSGN